MKSLAAATVLTSVAGAALAHPSLTAHDHPHGASALLGLDALALIALGLVVTGGAIAYAVRRAKK